MQKKGNKGRKKQNYPLVENKKKLMKKLKEERCKSIGLEGNMLFQSPLKSSVTSVGFGSSPTCLKTLMPSYKTLMHILGKPVQKLSVFIKVILYVIERFTFF